MPAHQRNWSFSTILLEEDQQTGHQRIDELQKWIKVMDGEMDQKVLIKKRR